LKGIAERALLGLEEANSVSPPKSTTLESERKARALSEFLRRVEARFEDSMEEIILFGSYARGDHDEESDIDLLIVGDVDFDELMEVVTDILLEYGELISPIVLKPEEFRKRRDSFIKTVLSEGKVLYSSISTP